jgi:hypothetical protein
MISFELIFFISSAMILLVMGVCYLSSLSGLQRYKIYRGSEIAMGMIWLCVGGLSAFFWARGSMPEMRWFLLVTAIIISIFGLQSFYLAIFRYRKTYSFGKIKKLIFSAVHIILSVGFFVHLFI